MPSAIPIPLNGTSKMSLLAKIVVAIDGTNLNVYIIIF
jgi:hypothetical protein